MVAHLLKHISINAFLVRGAFGPQVRYQKNKKKPPFVLPVKKKRKSGGSFGKEIVKRGVFYDEINMERLSRPRLLQNIFI